MAGGIKMLPEELHKFVIREKNLAQDFAQNAQERYPQGIYLYGAGSVMRNAVRFMENSHVKVNAILDSNKEGEYRGIPIIRFSEFLKSSPDTNSCFVISAPSARKAISEMLSRYFPKENILAFEIDVYLDFIPDVDLYREYLLGHWSALGQFYDCLSDSKSRDTFVSVIKGRIAGDLSYYSACYDPVQYYTPDIVRFKPGEVMVELGANNGETLLEFIQRCPQFKSAWCFEPGTSCQTQLKEIQSSYDGKIHIVPRAAWDSQTVLKFSDEKESLFGHVSENGGEPVSYLVETAVVDDIVSEPITYMKMDIEGAELRALHGAQRQIQENHPTLAVCVYHRWEDFLEIWSYLKELAPEYRFYLRHHLEASGTEIVLYAIDESRV